MTPQPRTRIGRATILLLAGIATLTLSATAQTPIPTHKNSYTPEQDVELGLQAAAEVRQELPLLADETVESYVETIGQRLLAGIPDERRQAAFRYSFDVVNVKDINAFALPGGPMFVHRGILEVARTEGEVAGVMAHEISHVVLRHGTVQATKGRKFQIGAILGQVAGAVVGGRTGSVIAQGSELGFGAYFLKYGREYEREADLLGAQILARVGYDPRQMANMFQTIERQGGTRGPEWLSSHPNPGNRYEAINREAASLQVQGSAGSEEQFGSVKSRLAQMAPAPTAAQIAQGQQRGQGQPRQVGTGGRDVSVQPPSGQWRTYQPGDFLRITVPANWRQVAGSSTVTYAPDGAYFEMQGGGRTFTHGVEIGVINSQNLDLQRATDQLVQGFAQANPQLRRQGGYQRVAIGGRRGLTATLTNVSEVTGKREVVVLSTAPMADGNMLFLIGVAPQDEAQVYQGTFGRVRESLRIADRGGLRQ